MKIGIATGVIKDLWSKAEIYPNQSNDVMVLTDEQQRQLKWFGMDAVGV